MMKKTKQSGKAEKRTAKEANNFEGRMERLEELTNLIRKTDIPLDEALKAFEEGIKLAKTLERDLEKIETKIEVLMNSSDDGPEEEPELGLFDENE